MTYLFLAGSAVLLILMAVQYGYGMNYRTELIKKLTSSESTEFRMQEIPDYQFSEKQVGDFHDIVERPLFFKVRKPIEPLGVESAEETAASEKLEFILTGVIDTPKGVYCLLQNPRAKDRQNKFKRLEQGEEIDGWSIDEIHPDYVVISSDGKSEEIKLAKPKAKKSIKAMARSKRKKPTINPKKNKQNPFKQKIKHNNT